MSAEVHGWAEYKGLFQGLVTHSFDWHILAEGDSWFNLGYIPVIGKPRNLLDPLNFRKSTVIADIALSGDTIKHISDLTNNPHLKEALAYRKWDLILISAGGNDLIDALTGNYPINGKAIELLKTAAASSNFMNYIDTIALEAVLGQIESYFHVLMEIKNSIDNGRNKDTKIVAHCYDYITPRIAPAILPFGQKLGPWAQKALKQHYIPPGQWAKITDFLFERLAERLLRLAEKIPDVYVINTLGTLHRAEANSKGYSNDWANEIHPSPDGYAKLAQRKISPALNPLL